jgi:hypothetical protein
MPKWRRGKHVMGNWLSGYDSEREVSGKRDSNPRPSAWEADALPTELLPHECC